MKNHLYAALLVPALLLSSGSTPASQTLGLATHGSEVAVFDAASNVLLGSVSLPAAAQDCALGPNGRFGYVSTASPAEAGAGQIWIIDLLSGPPALATGINPIPVSTRAGDLAGSRDGNFLFVAGDGGDDQPCVLVDLVQRREVADLLLSRPATVLSPADPGGVTSIQGFPGSIYVTTSANTRRLRLVAGELTDTGEGFAGSSFVNAALSPNGAAGVSLDAGSSQIVTFVRNSFIGLLQVDLRVLPAAPQSAVFHPGGTILYVRTRNGSVDSTVHALAFDPVLGTIGAELFSIPLGSVTDAPGIDTMAVLDGGSRIFARDGNGVSSFDAFTGALLSQLSLGAGSSEGSLCFMERFPGPQVRIDFETAGDGLTPLVNGQDIRPGQEFGQSVDFGGFSTAGFYPAIFDSNPSGPNSASSDPDLLVNRGNVLIFQENGQQSVPGIFDRPDDDRNGGLLTVDFLGKGVELSSIDLVDLCPTDGQPARLTFFDGSGRSRTFTVPQGWTRDVSVEGLPGVRTLDLTTLAPQPGFVATATANEDAGFNPADVRSGEIELASSGAIDSLEYLEPSVNIQGDGNGGNVFPFGKVTAQPSTRYQQVYDSSLFAGPMFISNVSFFPLAATTLGGKYAFYLSTTEKAVNGLNRVDLDANVGSDEQFFAEIRGGSTTDLFSILGRPFLYDPSQGNLLLEIRRTSGAPGGNVALRSWNGGFAGLSSRAHNYGVASEGWGLVTEFNTQRPAPLVPTGGLHGGKSRREAQLSGGAMSGTLMADTIGPDGAVD